jgi:hypothetical protein
MNTTLAFSSLLALLQNAEDGLSAREVFGSMPRDPASIFALLLIVTAAGAIMWFGRPKGGGGATP